MECKDVPESDRSVNTSCPRPPVWIGSVSGVKEKVRSPLLALHSPERSLHAPRTAGLSGTCPHSKSKFKSKREPSSDHRPSRSQNSRSQIRVTSSRVPSLNRFPTRTGTARRRKPRSSEIRSSAAQPELRPTWTDWNDWLKVHRCQWWWCRQNVSSTNRELQGAKFLIPYLLFKLDLISSGNTPPDFWILTNQSEDLFPPSFHYKVILLLFQHTAHLQVFFTKHKGLLTISLAFFFTSLTFTWPGRIDAWLECTWNTDAEE